MLCRIVIVHEIQFGYMFEKGMINAVFYLGKAAKMVLC